MPPSAERGVSATLTKASRTGCNAMRASPAGVGKAAAGSQGRPAQGRMIERRQTETRFVTMSSLSALKVLIVDPAKSLKDVLPTALNGAGIFDIKRVTDWPAATPTSCGPRHLLFVDWDAGPREAFGLVRSIRVRGAAGLNPQAPVIMVMGQAKATAIPQMRDSGVNEFLLKPLTTAAVIDRLARVIVNPKPFVDCDVYFGPERRRRGAQPFGGPYRRREDGVVLI